MSDDNPILSFAIPTWNRSKELQECLDSIIRQIIDSKENIEIFISDNASTDETPKVVQEYSKKYKFIRYSRNEKNIGPDLNFISVIEKSSGEYVWLFSDDDWLADGALKEILRIIKNYKPCYISPNHYWLDKGDDGKYTILKKQPQQKYMIDKDVNKAGINDVFLQRNHWLSFMSPNIFDKQYMNFDEYKLNVEKVQYWIQVYMVAQILAKQNCGYISSYYAVMGRVGKRRVNTSTFIKSMPNSFDYIFKKFNVDKRVQKKVIKGIRKSVLPFKSWLTNRDMKNVSPLLIPYYYKMFSILPDNFINFAWKFKRFLKGKGFSLPKGS